jgi:predicted PurR-regulated permease PerM
LHFVFRFLIARRPAMTPPPRPHTRRFIPGQHTFFRLATAALVVAGLYWAKAVLIPVALAVLLAFALTPLSEWLERRRLGRVPSALLVSAVALSLLGGLVWVAGVQVRHLSDELPRHAPELTQKFGPVLHLMQKFEEFDTPAPPEPARPTSPAELALGKPPVETKPANEPVPVTVVPQKGSKALEWLPSVAGSAAEWLATALLVAVLTVFLLVQRESVRDRVLVLAGRRGLTATTRALEDASRRVSRYLLLQATTNATMGTVAGVGLWLIGVPYAPLWGLLTAALRFVPYVGVWVAALFPFALAAAVSPGWWPALGVLALYGVCDGTLANVVEPLLFGHGTGVSPLALLVAATFWAFLWGPVGLLLAVPLTVCLVVLGEHVTSLKFLKTVLGDEPQVDPSARYFHRVLSHEADEAAVLVSEQAAGRPLIEVYDEVLLPTLAEAKTERDSGALSATEEREFYRVTRDVLTGVLAAQRAEEGAASEPARPAVRVVACSTKGEADRLALTMLRDVARPAGCEVEVVPAGRLAATARERAQHGADVVVCIAAVSPGGLAQAAGLIKQVRARVKGVRVLVGRWGMTGERAAAERFLTEAGAAKVTWTLRETLAEVAPGGAPPKPAKSGPETPAKPGEVTVPA